MESHKSVLVIGMNGVGLMLTTVCKARKHLVVCETCRS